jgi:CubicO group peptidase (beta-lactamase class C family)
MEVKTKVDQVLERAVASGAVVGVTAVAADRTGVVYQGAYGARTAGQPAGMTIDTVFAIASMTKAITSVAAMQQVEQGRLHLDEPLSTILPELVRIKVLEGFAADGTPQLRDPKRPITLRRLLTHTAGFVYDFWNADMVRHMAHTGIPNIGECKRATLMTPLVFDPGDHWDYGINIDWVGLAVEAVSGQSLEEYFKEWITGPLGMAATAFALSPAMRARVAGLHARQPDGSLAPIEFEWPQSPEFLMGGGGLYSTASDYLRFLQMLLHGGTLNGQQVLRRETVAQIHRNQIGDLNVTMLKTAVPAASNDAEFFPGMIKKWGLAYMITTEDAPTGRSAGSGAWAGMFNTSAALR